MIGTGILSLWLAAVAPASDEARAQAAALADEAESLRAADDLDGAREALARAYQLDPNPYFLFGRGRLAAEAEDCGEAVALMRQFLDDYPDADGADAAGATIEACGESVEPEPEPLPEPPPPVIEPPSPQPLEDAPTRPWHRDPAGGALLGTGAVGRAVGLGLYAGAVAERNAAEDAATTDEFRSSAQRTRTFETTGIVLASVGGALMVGAIVRYAIVRARGRTSAPIAGVRPPRP